MNQTPNISLVDKIKELDAAYRAYHKLLPPGENSNQLGKAIVRIQDARNDLGIFNPDSN